MKVETWYEKEENFIRIAIVSESAFEAAMLDTIKALNLQPTLDALRPGHICSVNFRLPLIGQKKNEKK